MFHQMITKQRDVWLASPACTVRDLLDYMEGRGFLRDAQLEAVKTYLYLKIGCGNKPLWQLFSDGAFTSLDVDELELRESVKQQLRADPAALALYEYATLRNDRGEQVSPAVEELIRAGAGDVSFARVFRDFFRVPYPDYLFSLPMGAGKTYLMAAFIYLDLYFAQAEPENRAFAHNFIIFAPSGLKSSVVPSLRTIQNFDPAWIIPEPAASGLRRLLKFEVLDQPRSARRSNRARNPNVQKVAAHQPFDGLMGLVLVANAEKAIYDKLDEEQRQLSLFPREAQEQIRQAAELRRMLGRLPSLAVYVDEVHHASDREIKLRRVIDHWTERRVDGLPTVTGVVGFSGTPYLDTAAPVRVGPVPLKGTELPNVVCYYPLARGVGNFLKQPLVYVSDNPDRLGIVAGGVRAFLAQYGDKVYPGGLTAKLAIYCGQIAPLEEEFLPLVNEIVAEHGLDPGEAVLKYYGKNSGGEYVCPPENATAFAALDTPLAKQRIILLAQIGKEGWDCRSLTGVILSQKGDCPTNMVLQTACRCLRQVERGEPETAGIWLNQFNAAKLEAQLQKEQHISIREFAAPPARTVTAVPRHDRTAYLALPALDFYQLRVRYTGEAVREGRDARAEILAAPEGLLAVPVTRVTDFSGRIYEIRPDEVGLGDPVTYARWLYLICKESFPIGGDSPVTLTRLAAYDAELQDVFRRVTAEEDGVCRYLLSCAQALVRSRIRAALADRVVLRTEEEPERTRARLLRAEKLTSPVLTPDPAQFYPPAAEVERLLAADQGRGIDSKTEAAIALLRESGHGDMAEKLIAESLSLPERERSYHYLPYRFDSGFERTVFRELVGLKPVRDRGLEVYYNGDRALTEFRIRCYRGAPGSRHAVGWYTPDLLVAGRRDGQFRKVLIVETKGEGFAGQQGFLERRAFMEEFLRMNNEASGYARFGYLYVEEGLDEGARQAAMSAAISDFFGEDA